MAIDRKKLFLIFSQEEVIRVEVVDKKSCKYKITTKYTPGLFARLFYEEQVCQYVGNGSKWYQIDKARVEILKELWLFELWKQILRFD